MPRTHMLWAEEVKWNKSGVYLPYKFDWRTLRDDTFADHRAN